MKNSIFTLFALIGMTFGAYSQDKSLSFDLNGSTSTLVDKAEVVADADTAWKSGGLIGFNTSQTFLNNWAAGGVSSVSGTSYLNLFKNYAEGSWAWDNNLNLSLGLLRNDLSNANLDVIKIDDKISFTSVAGKQAFNNWYYTANLSFLSQFLPGYTVEGGGVNGNKISDLFAPAFIEGGLGMSYKPNDNFILTISPIATKNTIVNSANSKLRPSFGLDLDESVRSELGGSLRLGYKRALAENIDWQTSLILFSNYAKNPGNVDTNWENIFAMKLAKYFNINLIVQMLYDDDIKLVSPGQLSDSEGNLLFEDDGTTPVVGNLKSTLQFREVFGIGFSYKF